MIQVGELVTFRDQVYAGNPRGYRAKRHEGINYPFRYRRHGEEAQVTGVYMKEERPFQYQLLFAGGVTFWANPWEVDPSEPVPVRTQGRGPEERV